MVIRLIFLSIFLLSFSCAQRLKVPINRMMTPEVIGGGADIEFHRIGFSQARLDFSDGKTNNPLNIAGVVNNRSLYLAAGVSQTTDIFVRVPQESSSLLGIKVQVLGVPSKVRNGGHQAAFTIALGSARDSFDGAQKINLKSDVRDYSILYGYRFGGYVLSYISLSLSDYKFDGSIVSSTRPLDGNEISYRARNTLGGQIGIDLGGEAFALKLELAAQKITWTNTETELLYSSGLSIRATF